MTTALSSVPRTLTMGGDLVVNRLGYGAMHLTGPGMWGDPVDPDNAIALLRRAVELGITFIDTADSYGPGHNERIIRRALHPYPDDVVICTKGGLLRSGPKDWTREGDPYIVPLGRPEYLRQQVEVSLCNLGMDCIDLYQLHSIDPTVPVADQFGALVELQQQGKIRHIGVSGQPEVTAAELEAIGAYADIVAVENLFNIADRAGTGALRYAEEHDIAFIPWFPLGHGDLVGPDSPLNTIAAQFGVTPPQLALSWLLHVSPNTLLIPGTTSIAHLEQNLAAWNLQLSAADMTAITTAVDQSGVDVWRPTR
ncbi:Putative oxidoreductase YdbC [Mycobacterium basiliense]|uniref:Oxidoreductase YdbC n=1 Tax=Mycobacterium basiliense TaxID=2094119 RepID=A0A3S4FUA5_9MYCO|nr:aldo/keto reductase [Mycobacterium basiliense]VDM90877.1 Putative oxidoreductase YdbC [Mycobacterium basiliense]